MIAFIRCIGAWHPIRPLSSATGRRPSLFGLFRNRSIATSATLSSSAYTFEAARARSQSSMSAANGNDPAWRPDEDSTTIRAEELWLQGAFVACVAYGAVAILCIQCFFMLLRGFKKSKLFRDGPLIVFAVLIFCLNTVYVGLLIQLTQQAFIDDRNFPGGPAGYELTESLIPINVGGNTALVVITMLADALLLWRCTIIYRNSTVTRWLSIGLAAIFWLTEFVLGTLLLVLLTRASVFGTVNLVLGFWCFSLALNVLATLLICGRLLYYRWQLKNALGSDHISQYTGVIAMVVESELLYTAYLIVFIVPFVRGDMVAEVFLQNPSLIQSVSALMIVYRVASGKAWSKDTHATVTSRRMGSSGVQLSNLSTLRVAPSTTFDTTGVKSEGGIQVTQDISMYVHGKRENSSDIV